ncbi:hypothetical protein Tco_0033313 [Tanacetum coccineum]
MVKFIFHLLDLSSGIILLYQKLLEFNPGTSLDPPWSDLELHLCGDEFLRLVMSVVGYGGRNARWKGVEGVRLQWSDKEVTRRLGDQGSGPTEPIPDEAINDEHVATPFYDPSQSVLALETTKSNQALEITSLKRRVKTLEKRRKSKTPGFKRLRKVGSASRVESSTDVSFGAQEDASKQGRKIVEIVIDLSRICFTDNINVQRNIKNSILSNKVFILIRFHLTLIIYLGATN